SNLPPARLDFVRDEPGQYLGLSAFYQRKRDLFAGLLADSKFRPLPCAGTYFQLADYSALLPECGDLDDLAFAKWLTTEKGVATIPLSPFYQTPPGDRIIRFCFAKQDETLRRAGEILGGI
ncbi:MAG: aminotransferase class I/II-fold pyridoxal phosphate-dependent enzyme, partial [Gammaproteobacteria bacterium]|nr:aminotransferase class I/II-fold pyridoxal phosphate-dependent enzyme [Gammaproteobacteria bacterium]